MSKADEWLIRTADNRISGPFSRQQITAMIQNAQLKLDDEVCGAGSFWIYIHENQEIKAQLGIEIPKALYGKNKEATQTETDTEVGDRTDPENIVASVIPETSDSQGESSVLPELDELIDDLGENTAVMSNRAFRDYHQKKTPISGTHLPKTENSGSDDSEVHVGMEKSKLAQYLAIFMMTGAVVLIVLVIRLLRQQPG